MQRPLCVYFCPHMPLYQIVSPFVCVGVCVWVYVILMQMFVVIVISQDQTFQTQFTVLSSDSFHHVNEEQAI